MQSLEIIILFCSVQPKLCFFILEANTFSTLKLCRVVFLPAALHLLYLFLQKAHFFQFQTPKQNIMLHLFESRFLSDGSFWKVGLELLFKTELKLFQGEKRWEDFILSRKSFLNQVWQRRDGSGMLFISLHLIACIKPSHYWLSFTCSSCSLFGWGAVDEPEASSFPAGKGFFLEQDENRELNAFSPPRGGWFGFVLGFFWSSF